jgi:hypothetical protein
MFITLELLERKDACPPQRELFQSHFPNGVEVTVEGCVAVAGVFDWSWAAEYLLPHGGNDAYEDALAEAEKVYYDTTDAIWEAFDAAIAAKRLELPAWDGADREVYEAWRRETSRVHTETRDAAKVVLEKAQATAFATQAMLVTIRDSAPAQPQPSEAARP